MSPGGGVKPLNPPDKSSPEYSEKYTCWCKNSMCQAVYMYDALRKVCVLRYKLYLHSYSQSHYH